MSKKNKKDKASAVPADGEKKENTVRNVFGHPVRNLIAAAVISILLGVAFILKPYEVSLYCGYGVGGLFAVLGIVYIIMYFCNKPVSGEYRSEFAIGLLSITAGAYVALSGMIFGGSGVGYVLVIRIIGILILADALLKLQYAVDTGRMGFKPWWIILILALLGAGIGTLAVTDFSKTAIGSSNVPVSFLYTLGINLGLVTGKGQYNEFFSGMMMLGIGFCLNGLLDLISMTFIAVRNHKARRDEAIAEGTAMVAAAQMEELDECVPVGYSAPEGSVYTPAPVQEAPVSAPAPAAAPEPATVVVDPPQAVPAEPME